MHSQNSEEAYILQYFKDYTGSFLDLGAYDGVDLSNTRALANIGWSGVCVEPNPEVFERLVYNYIDNKKVTCYECAVGIANGIFNFYQNSTYYSTIVKEETIRWIKDATIKFKRAEVEVFDFKTFIKNCSIKQFDFISIDCEGLDYDILIQMDLKELGCKMICVEHNGKDTGKYIDYINQYNMKVVHINPENLIMAL
jgi:FkbM family methyltransferase